MLTGNSLVKAGKSIIKHFTDPTYDAFLKEEEKAERLRICNECDNLETFFGKKRCKICLCFVEAKASLADQKCPDPGGSKWPERTS